MLNQQFHKPSPQHQLQRRPKQSKNEADDSCSSSDEPGWVHHSQVDLQQLTPMLRHYVELKAANPKRMLVKEIDDDLLFLHQVVKGGASSGYGVAAARLAGAPNTIVRRAQHILDSMPKNEIELVSNIQIHNL